ncbi:MAG: isocitrate/isopropylmalate dehydrogenase family protein [Chloroflexi bacterium]|uniref:Isocitrate/isopropylmalate dehydrogenase family protein n=1 Tax=Candidatus Chlorohelix allophototropha TaxID=3003348 RepID=A0A8T7M7X5_9CHLR|nr:isocitrate/isopropylmalate dehydrogenase family protein [Chloroflexota bacterium]WJW68155.1 isocitrate/isopropylmalate dehydrogenase family protein [Chloroflexota bacterium L227-S17]
MSYNVTLIPGDGIGPEVTEATRRVLDATGIEFNWEVKNAGGEELERSGSLLPEGTLESVRRNKVAIKGPITTPIGKGFRSINVALRQSLDLYSCVRPCKFYKGVNSRYDSVDLVFVRENMEDLYAGVEYRENQPETKRLITEMKKDFGSKLRDDMALSIKTASAYGTRRIVKYAFDYARDNNRRKVTVVHKANIMKFTDGLFLDTAREIAKEYPDIEFSEVIVDAITMHLVQYPEDYDVLVLPNLYGDILSDLGAGLIGGPGMAPGGNIGDEFAVFEATHGSAPQIAGQNIANPLAMILSGLMMLRHLREFDAAKRLEKAIAAVIEEGNKVTIDMKHDRNAHDAVGTQEAADAIIGKLQLL